MSRATVRQAIVDWFQPQYVDGLTSCYRAQAKEIPASKIIPPNTGTGATAQVFIKHEVESRRALGGAHSGKKMLTYDCALVIQFVSVLPDAEDGMDACDALIENLKRRLRADRTLGGNVWQAGEAPDQMSGTSIEITSDLPRQVGDAVHIWFEFLFPVVDWETT